MIKRCLFVIIFAVVFSSISYGGTKKQRKKVVVINRSSVPTYVNPPGNAGIKILLDETNGSKNAYFGLCTFLPGVKVPAHLHKDSDEILYILSGGGILKAYGKEYHLKAGDAILIPAGVKHSYINDSKLTPTQCIQIYAKPGPQNRFKKWKTLKE